MSDPSTILRHASTILRRAQDDLVPFVIVPGLIGTNGIAQWKENDECFVLPNARGALQQTMRRHVEAG